MELTPFDQMISSENMQILKVLLPYMSPENQRLMAIYVKFSELQHTLSLFQNFSKLLQIQDFEKQVITPSDIIHEIQPYLSNEASDMLETFSNMMSTVEMVKSFQEASATDGNKDSAFDPMSMMKTMLTPEQQDMFDMYQTAFTTEHKTVSDEGGEESD